MFAGVDGVGTDGGGITNAPAQFRSAHLPVTLHRARIGNQGWIQSLETTLTFNRHMTC
jgi:hypothetical protein